MIFPCRHHFQDDNKQPYSHTGKLPEARFMVIRFFPYSAVFGSVPRWRNKQSGHFRWCAAGQGAGNKHNIQKKAQLAEWHILCFRAAARRGGLRRSGTGFFRIFVKKRRNG
jgi:hypothetical protein